MTDDLEEDDWTFAPDRPHWRCEECGHTDYRKPLPADRAKWYAAPREIKCPRCKSIGFHPHGW